MSPGHCRLQQAPVLHPEGHRHAGHEVLDIAVADHDLLSFGPDREHLAMQLVLLRWGARRWHATIETTQHTAIPARPSMRPL